MLEHQPRKGEGEYDTIISPHKSIPVTPPKLPIHELLGLLEGDVHVTVN